MFVYLAYTTFVISEALFICSVAPIFLCKGITSLLVYSALGTFDGLESFKQSNMGFVVKDGLRAGNPLLRSASPNVACNALISDLSGGVELQSDAIILGALSADTASIASGFPVEGDEFDLDLPSEGFSSIPEAIEDIYNGKVGLLVDVVILMKAETFT